MLGCEVLGCWAAKARLHDFVKIFFPVGFTRMPQIWYATQSNQTPLLYRLYANKWEFPQSAPAGESAHCFLLQNDWNYLISSEERRFAELSMWNVTQGHQKDLLAVHRAARSRKPWRWLQSNTECPQTAALRCSVSAKSWIPSTQGYKTSSPSGWVEFH